MHLILFLYFITGAACSYRDLTQLHRNVSSTLDRLLASSNYDKRLRPSFGGHPVNISVNMLIKSMGPVSDDEQSYGIDCYFRQHWYDTRLTYEKLPGLTEFSLTWLFMENVWKPDTYFVNGKKAFLHRITAPNKFLRLRYDGFITYSMRLTIFASCPMYLRKFPLDAQRCPLILGSYGYTSKDVAYHWDPILSIKTDSVIDLAQFDLVKITHEDESLFFRGGHYYSTLKADFWLQRHTGYFMLQVYVPCGLIVLCSWVSFWIDPDDVTARVALGVTTVLSLTTLGFGGRQQLPKVSYWTALDWFVIICFTSVFSVMIEYACVNFLDKVTKDLMKVIEKRKKDEVEKQKKEEEVATTLSTAPIRQRSASMSAIGREQEQLSPPRSSSNADLAGASGDLLPPAKPRKSSLLDFSKKLKLIPRKLSATVKDFIDVPKIQDRFTKSVQNLTRLDQVFRDPDMTIPRVVVSSADGDSQDLAVDLDLEGDWCDLEADDVVSAEKPEPSFLRAFCQFLRNVYKLLIKWKFLPEEEDVVKIMEDSDPPDKFSKIDIESRKGFPIAFFSSMLLYMFAFAYYLSDEFPQRDIVIMNKN